VLVDPDLVAAITVPLSIVGTVYSFMHYATKWRLAKVKPSADLENRMARLEVAIDDMSAELTRMIEGQQIVTKMLAEHASEASHGTR
jgi:hypothetical protein